MSGGVLVAASPAAQARCPYDVRYHLTASNNYMPFRNMPIYRDGRGGTLSVTRDFTSSTSYQVTVGAESEVGAVLAKAKVSISGSLTRTNSSSVTHNYSHKISASKFGHVQYVSWGKTVHWTKYIDTEQCTTKTAGSGTIKFPSTSEGWRYWETSN